MKHQHVLALSTLLAISFLPALLLALGGAAQWSYLQICVILLTSFCSLLTLASIYRAMPRLTVFLTTLVTSLALVELVMIVKFHWYLDVTALAVLAETNATEASAFSASVPWSALGCAMLVIIALARLAWPTRQRDDSHLWPHKSVAVGGTLAWVGIVAVTTFFATSMHSSADPFFQPNSGSAAALRAGFPSGLPWVVADYLRQRRALARAAEMHRHFKFGVSRLPTAKHRRVYVLVIGESSREDRWGINGYKRDTTPLLAKRHALVSFKRMFTPWTYTRMAIPVMISRKPWNLNRAVYKEDSIVEAFKEAGFSTHWISLQPTVGFNDSPITVYAREADHLALLNEYSHSAASFRRDDAAIPLLEHILETPVEGDTFVIIHTWGSHFRYTTHYLPTDARFLPDRPRGRLADLYNRKDLPELSNAYDDTIYFTDKVLDGLIGELARHPAVQSWLMYASDHGEGLFDDCKMESGHGPNKSYYTEHVAALFWPSPVYTASFPSKVATMKAHSATLASSDMLFETISDLAGLQVPGNRRANSLAGSPLRVATESLDAEHAMLLRCRATARYAAHPLSRQQSPENIHTLVASGSPERR